MSLINDALRRAKDAQQQAPLSSSPDLPFRPVEPAQQRARRGLGLLLPAALAVVAILVLFVAWQWAQQGGPVMPREAAARTARPAQTPAEAPLKPAGVDTAAAVAAIVSPPQLPPPVSAATPVGEATTGVTNPPVADTQVSQATDAAPVAAPEPPKPAPLRLQAIFFSPKRPSVIISGKTAFVGDKLGDLRVVAIDQESATLAGAGQTNVLSLSN